MVKFSLLECQHSWHAACQVCDVPNHQSGCSGHSPSWHAYPGTFWCTVRSLAKGGAMLHSTFLYTIHIPYYTSPCLATIYSAVSYPIALTSGSCHHHKVSQWEISVVFSASLSTQVSFFPSAHSVSYCIDLCCERDEPARGREGALQ